MCLKLRFFQQNFCVRDDGHGHGRDSLVQPHHSDDSGQKTRHPEERAELVSTLKKLFRSAADA
jgi:hypothetical protein